MRMAETVGGERRRRPPTRVMRAINRVPAALLRSPLHRPLSKRLLLLTFNGRRSGRRFTTPVGYVQADERTLLLGTERPWYKNLLGGAPVVVRLRGRDVAGRSEVIEDEGGMAAAYKTMLARDPGYGRFVGVSLDPSGESSPEQVRRARERGLVVIRIDLDEPAPAATS